MSLSHNVELHDRHSFIKYYSRDRIKKNGEGQRRVARMGETGGARRHLVGKPEGKRPLGRPRRRWGNNTIIEPQETGLDFSDSGEGQGGGLW